MKTEYSTILNFSAFNAVMIAKSEAEWRQRSAVDASHLLWAVISFDENLMLGLQSRGLRWADLSEDVEEFVRPSINIVNHTDKNEHLESPAWTDTIEAAVKLAKQHAHPKIGIYHLLCSLTYINGLEILFENKWAMPATLRSYAEEQLSKESATGNKTVAQQIKVAERSIEILQYRELNSRTIFQKSQIQSVRKAKHQWEEELVSLKPGAEE